jgi:hypothetical protein
MFLTCRHYKPLLKPQQRGKGSEAAVKCSIFKRKLSIGSVEQKFSVNPAAECYSPSPRQGIGEEHTLETHMGNR